MSQEVYVKEKLKLIFSCVLILICLPYFVTYCFQGEPAKATVKTDESIEIAGILLRRFRLRWKKRHLKHRRSLCGHSCNGVKRIKEGTEPLQKRRWSSFGAEKIL